MMTDHMFVLSIAVNARLCVLQLEKYNFGRQNRRVHSIRIRLSYQQLPQFSTKLVPVRKKAFSGGKTTVRTKSKPVFVLCCDNESCVRTCTHVYVCLCMCTGTYACARISTHVWMCTYTDARVRACAHVYVHLCTYTYVFTYV